MEVADSIQEVKTICVGCERKSIVNAKFMLDQEAAGKIIIKNNDSKNQVDLGSEDKYQPMCWKCWQES